jgi:glycerol-1-phosphatase
MSLLERYAAVVCDLDGVVYRGKGAVPGAVEALRRSTVPVVYATNNASRPPVEVSRHLNELGLDTSAGDVVTSAQAGAHYLATLVPPDSPVLAVGGPGVLEALREKGFHPTPVSQVHLRGRRESTQRFAAVLQGYGAGTTAADLAEAAYAVQSGAVWVATNTDGTLPTDRGIAPGNGTLVAAVQRAVGRPPTVVGKPYAPLYLLCAEKVHRDPSRILAVGDRLDTDIAGATEAGMDSALVLTGVDLPATVAAAPPEMRPTYLLSDLEGLHTAYQPVERVDAWWSCGADRRRIVAGRWETGAVGQPIEALRAALAAIHHALDDEGLDPAEAARLVSDIEGGQ